jgi:hypothetical protein
MRYIFLSGRHHCMLSTCCLAVHAGLVSVSPLYYAARDDRIKVAQTLLSAGADPTRGLTLLAGDGGFGLESPVDVATELQHKGMAKILKAHRRKAASSKQPPPPPPPPPPPQQQQQQQPIAEIEPTEERGQPGQDGPEMGKRELR